MAAFSTATLHPNLPTTSHQRCKLCFSTISSNRAGVGFAKIVRGRGHSRGFIRLSLNDNKKRSINGNEAADPARALLEKLFAQTQKLEDKVNGMNGFLPRSEEGLNFEILESDLQAVLIALKKKEEDLQLAERIVVSEHAELKNAKEELERREQDLLAACWRQQKLEEELKHANLELASGARQVEDLRLCLLERDREINAMKSALCLKEDEIGKLCNKLATKSDEAAKTDSELRSMAQVLSKANKVVRKQKAELQQLKRAIHEKEEELDASVTLRKLEQQKLNVVKDNLKKQTMQWLLVQEDLKLSIDTSLHIAQTNEALEDFERVKNLLADVRSELVSSQKSLASSRQKMEEKEQLLEKQLSELEQQRVSVMSHMMSLKDAALEVESEIVKLRVAEARNKELEHDLSLEKELVKELQLQLEKERTSLLNATQEISVLQEELDHRSSEFEEMHNLLKLKESGLVEAKLEIQQLTSELNSLRLISGEKDSELIIASNKLEEANQEVNELKLLMSSRENQLALATNLFQEKEKHAQTVQHELNDAKIKSSEAETVVERIVQLTQKLIFSSKDDANAFTPSVDMSSSLLQCIHEEPHHDFKWEKKQVETELQLTRENLKMKETEILAAQRALALRDVEHKVALERLNAKEQELQRMKAEMTEEANDLKNLYSLVQERIGEKSIGDLAIEKLQIEAAQLEVEAATSALQKLAEMSRTLLDKASTSIETDTGNILLPQNSSGLGESLIETWPFPDLKAEVARLASLTEKLVIEAGLVRGAT